MPWWQVHNLFCFLHAFFLNMNSFFLLMVQGYIVVFSFLHAVFWTVTHGARLHSVGVFSFLQMLFFEQVLVVQGYIVWVFFLLFCFSSAVFWTGTCGARLHSVFFFSFLQMLFFEQVLMVQGYNSKTSWGFPKGKMETHESETECAIREVRPIDSCFLLGKMWDSFMNLTCNALLER